MFEKKIENKMILHIKENKKKYLFLFGFFALGVILGSFCIKILDSSSQAEVVVYLKNFFNLINEESTSLDKKELFLNYLIRDLKTYILLFVFGLTSLGVFFSPSLLVFKGFVIGFTNAFLVKQFGLKGFFFSLVAIIPQNFLKITILLFVSLVCFSFSLNRRGNKKTRQMKSKITFSLFFSYFVLFFIAFIINIIPILLESYVVPVVLLLFSSYLL